MAPALQQKLHGPRRPGVWEDDADKLWLECGTRGCDGSPIDWAPCPWWDENHPATQEWLKNHPEDDGAAQEDGDDDSPF